MHIQRVIKQKPYSYFLIETGGCWHLTYMIGGPFEIDNCVKLTDEEISKIKENPEYTIQLMEKFKSDQESYKGRRIIPSIRPDRS